MKAQPTAQPSTASDVGPTFRSGESGRLASARGQSILEFGLVLPLMLVIVFGISELGLGLLHSHSVDRISREAANLISRGTSLEDAAEALDLMADDDVDFDSNSRLILSVLKRGEAAGTANYDELILYQRYEFGSLAATSKVTTDGTPSFSGPDYVAADSNNNTALRVTNFDDDLIVVRGGLVYVTEVFSSHPAATPLSAMGITVSGVMYSMACF